MGQLDLRRLRLLRELRDRGTVTAVGAALHMTSSAVSQQLALLARDVGAPLLEPHGRRVRLTDAARLLLRHADLLFAQLEVAQTELDAYVSGAAATVRLDCFATSVAALAVPAMRRVALDAPQLTLRLREADTEEALDRLVRDETDVVVGLDGEVRVDDARFTRTPLLVDPLDVVLPSGHPRAAAADLRLADLAGEPWIVPPAGLCRDIAVRECALAGFTPRTAHTADSYVSVFALVRAGHGVALVPRMCAADREPGLTVRTPRAQQPSRQVSLFVRAAGDRAPHMRLVAEALREAADELEKSFSFA
ncbi:LysR family transcriptional regulator [Amorphoplanes digitatis]|uniref:DNA-binding transcriptional LysR family regulator n=1 Tax=Actinoplanes digitatis TaxID=1868 RepID=A0A7W7HXQ2_9ACTN|nr:LysR family transcriptional regulator [Actinoplanes digitatis]MBB4762703.1 DNA-binding transcriptional LysR family regulator [Actinoplanes digitatis]GID91800.1 LysR family transcriptional regulator [Actinoplanes digitatis]